MKVQLCAALLLTTCLCAPVAFAAPAAPPVPSPMPAERRISIRFENAPVANVLGMIGEQAGFNLAIAGDVTGNVKKIFLKDVPPEAAIQLVCQAAGLQWRKFDDGSYMVAKVLPGATQTTPVPPTPQEVTPRKEVEIARATIPLRFVPARLVQQWLLAPANGFAPGVRRIVAVEPNNLLLVEFEDSPEGRKGLDALLQIVAQLDKPQRKIAVEAKLVSLDAADFAALGVTFDETPHLTVLPRDWEAQLQTLVKAGRARIVAAPCVEVVNNLSAAMTDALNVLRLSVTPTLNNDGTITLLLLSTKPKLQTVANVRDGATLALGGLRTEQGGDSLLFVTAHALPLELDVPATR